MEEPLGPEYPIHRTRDWLGRERLVLRVNGRRYHYRSLDAALRARARIQARPRLRRLRRILGALLALSLLATLAIWRYPPLLLQAVDLARGIFGPGPVAYVETTVFRFGTFIRQTRVQLGDTAPRWGLEGVQAPVAALPSPAGVGAVQSSTATAPPTPAHTPTPTATPTRTLTPTPTAEPVLGRGFILHGGNLRSAPQVAPETLIGLLWEGDQIDVLERQLVDEQTWLRIRLTAPSASRGGPGAGAGATGWISVVLVTPPTPTPAAPPPPPPPPTRTPPRPIQVRPVPGDPAGGVPGPRADWPPAPLVAQIQDGQLPNEGQWQLLPAIGDGGAPAMAATVLRPDPARPDIQVALVAVDLTRAQLYLAAGTEEPPGPPDAPRAGAIPEWARTSGTLLAAFNGGFKAIHGNDGMAADGVTYLAPIDNRATIAITGDGDVRVGLWGRDFGAGDNLLAWRQNGHLLVDGGQVTARARQGGPGWGASLDLQAETWRSGVGVSPDRRTLFYAVGDALTSARLAEVMRAAGAGAALQLDINSYLVRFVTFQRTEDGRVVARPLISAMANEPAKYLAPEKRDFFYLAAR